MGSRYSAITLNVVKGPEAGPFELNADVVAAAPAMIGRQATSCQVMLPDKTVSRQHAEIRVESSAWTIRDVGSRHGTFHNRVRLDDDEVIPIEDGDHIRIGVWSFIVTTPEGLADVAPPEPTEVDVISEATALLEAATDDTYETRATLLDDIKQGKRWPEFFDKYAPVIRGFCRNAQLPPHEIDDICQDVLASFVKALDGFEYDRKKGRFRGYLKTITLNAIRSRYRRKRPQPVADEQLVLVDTSVTPELWDSEWVRQLLLRAIDLARAHFDAPTIEAFELYGVRGVPVAEVASQLGLSQESVRSAKSRVARKVRSLFDELRQREG